jgi:acyl-CoA thioester hydrolase
VAAVAVELEIPFHDVDSLRLVWHGHFCKYLEIGRTALFRAHGLDAKDVFGLGYHFLVTETHVRHLQPLRYADLLRVASWFGEIDNRIRVAYELTNLSTQRVCAVASTTLVTVTGDGGLCLETPGPILARLNDRRSSSA